MLIGISGYARAGKDSLASFLIEDHGYKRYAFADALRGVVYALNPVVGVAPDIYGGNPLRVQDIVDLKGWDAAKVEHEEIRRLLQAMGTEAGRKILGENIWVDTVFRQIAEQGDENVVITDVRFPNEALEVKAQGGFIVRVNRPGVAPVNAHPSEVALDEWGFDYTVPNDGTLDQLRSMAKYLNEDLTLMQAQSYKLPSTRLPGYGAPTAKVT